MKIVEKLSLALFSNIILILSILLCLIIFGWLDIDVTFGIIKYGLITGTVSNIVLGTCVVLIILAIKCIFFDSYGKDSDRTKDGILLENNSGKLLISRETLENLANSVVKGFENTENINSRIMLDKENNLRVNVTLSVKQNTIIKELSNNLQDRIKEAIKTSLDLEVKEVNIRIKNIAPKAADNSTKGE
jgi:uncharacterized alkaline shock family protein YloU